MDCITYHHCKPQTEKYFQEVEEEEEFEAELEASWGMEDTAYQLQKLQSEMNFQGVVEEYVEE